MTLRTRLEFEKGHSFFMCKECLNVRVTFEDAMEPAFRGSGCNGQMVSDDNRKTIQLLEDLSRKLESELSDRPAALFTEKACSSEKKSLGLRVAKSPPCL